MIAADSERPTWPSFFAATPASNSSRVSPAPTFARSGPRRLAASTTRVTRTESTRHAGRSDGEDEAVHDEARVDARAEHRDALRLRQPVDLPRHGRVAELGKGELLAGRDDVEAGVDGLLDLRQHRVEARARAEHGDVGLAARVEALSP